MKMPIGNSLATGKIGKPCTVLEPGAFSEPPAKPAKCETSMNDNALSASLSWLRNHDQSCIFVVRGVNKLGFESSIVVEKHFMMYGNVERVFVAHSKATRPIK